ncbi:MAG: RAMP superfamily CRISPR-associated protein [Anaerolineae bacterium]
MTWIAHKIVLRLLTPLHIGAAKLGNVQRTRPYVTGKVLWGALTARLTRDHPGFSGDYRKVGDRVKEELAFSYFYPAVGDQVDLWPWKAPDAFAWRYLGSYASTALDYSRNTAEEGSLHETEFIAPTTRDSRPVFLVGYIFEQEGCTLPWQEALPRLQIGGERTYGWGRVALHAATPSTESLFGCYELDLLGTRPAVTLTENDSLLAHTRAHGAQAIPARGRLTPLVGRETRAANAHGRHLSTAVICWEPGSIAGSVGQAAIGPYGIWEKAEA